MIKPGRKKLSRKSVEFTSAVTTLTLPQETLNTPLQTRRGTLTLDPYPPYPIRATTRIGFSGSRS